MTFPGLLIPLKFPLWGGPMFLVGTIPRSFRICVPNLVMIGPAVWPPIVDRHTHTHRQTDRQNLYYIDIDWKRSKQSVTYVSLPGLYIVSSYNKSKQKMYVSIHDTNV